MSQPFSVESDSKINDCTQICLQEVRDIVFEVITSTKLFKKIKVRGITTPQISTPKPQMQIVKIKIEKEK